MRPHVRLTQEEDAQISSLYQEREFTIAAIGQLIDRNAETIRRSLKRQGIPIDHSRGVRIKLSCSDEELVRMYTTDLMDSYEISCLFGVCSQTISKRLKENGVKMRPPGVNGAKLRSGERGVHGLSSHPLYQIWNGMIQRCYIPANKGWAHYGGSGVTVCERWRNRPAGFANFLTDMGTRPPGTSLDRINPFGNYEPSNCRWATQDEQAHNKRGSRKNIQRLLNEINMWKERALRAEERLAELDS